MTTETAKIMGPWFVGVMNDALFIIDQKPCPPTEFVHPGHEPSPNVIATVCNQDDHKETDANGRMLAAAPELYKAAKKALRSLENGGSENKPQLQQELRDAIRKAEEK